MTDVVFKVYKAGEDGQCGCPICCATTVYCEDVLKTTGYVPAELTGILTEGEYTTLIEGVNKILHDTHWPMLPCIFAHFCLPFSPFCAAMYCRSQRTNELKAFLEEQSNNLRERGLYWSIGNAFDPGTVIGRSHNTTVYLVPAKPTIALLKVHAVGRAKYETENPQQRSLMYLFQPQDQAAVSVQINNTVTTIPSPTQPIAYATPSSQWGAPQPYTGPPAYGAPQPYPQAYPQAYPQPYPQQAPPQPYPQQAPSSNSAFCNQCGNAVSTDSKFCNKCGHQINTA